MGYADNWKKVEEATSLDYMYLDSGSTKGGTDSDDFKFMPMTQSQSDIPQVMQDRAFTVCFYLYQTNPLAHKFVHLLEAFTMGDGPVPIAADPAVQELLDEFWNNEHNDMVDRSMEFSRELSIYGEQTYLYGKLYDDESDPIIGLQMVNPRSVMGVAPSPFDRRTMSTLQLNKSVIPGVTEDDDPQLIKQILTETKIDGVRRLTGDALFYRINNAADSTRGLSDLYPLADWLQLYSEYQFNMAERLNHMSMYFFDVVLEDADEAAIAKFRQELQRRPPKPGGIIVHSQTAQMNLKNVDMKGGSELVDVSKSFFGTVATGLGWPAHWTSLGSDGRAAAEAANDPIYKLFASRQSMIKRSLSKFARLQIDKAVQEGHLQGIKSEQFKLLFPRLGMRDFQRAGGTAARIAQALRDSVQAGLLPADVANKFLLSTLEQIGIVKQDFDTQGLLSPKESVIPVLPTDAIASNDHKYIDRLSAIENTIDEVLESKTLASNETKESVTSEWLRIFTYCLED
tara:strand:- start:1101 stop:2639 length:1539 start_codon:yes stop_codon:yes gene_type:complete